jgi:hypothetical protein
MLPSYPPLPPHLTGFDAMLMYASVEDADARRSAKILRALRRESLRRGAKLSAAKALHRMNSHAHPRLRFARELASEAPSPATYFWLVSAEVHAGNADEARSAAHRMLSAATQVGDLDKMQTARLLVERPSACAEPMPDRPVGFRDRLSKACSAKADGSPGSYAAVLALQQEALSLGGRATAIECARQLLREAALSQDVPAGVRFARDLVVLEASSYSHLALGLARERAGSLDEARLELARALRFACVEGDLHRVTKATAGLLRTNSRALVTEAELRWTLPEAKQEPQTLPDYLYLQATLGLHGAA